MLPRSVLDVTLLEVGGHYAVNDENRSGHRLQRFVTSRCIGGVSDANREDRVSRAFVRRCGG